MWGRASRCDVGTDKASGPDAVSDGSESGRWESGEAGAVPVLAIAVSVSR
jgi:hypothetical protein